MKKYIVLIRHGNTLGNLEYRYIGYRTDEGLCDKGIDQIEQNADYLREYLKSDTLIFSSPMVRCIQTVSILFPEEKYAVISELTEIDFGDFENKNYSELRDNSDYQMWIDSSGKKDFPNGEALDHFVARSMAGFHKLVKKMEQLNASSGIVVCHGGNIMAIMSTLTSQEYFDFQIDNASAIYLELEIEDDNIDLISYSRI